MEFDDKNLVIICVTLLATFVIFKIGETALGTVDMIITGLMGIAIGKGIK